MAVRSSRPWWPQGYAFGWCFVTAIACSSSSDPSGHQPSAGGGPLGGDGGGSDAEEGGGGSGAGPTACTDNQYESAPPTPTTDRVCTALTICTAEQYESVAPTSTSDRTCTELTVCTLSQYIEVASTTTSDRVCAECDAACATCTGAGPNNCSSCPADYQDNDNSGSCDVACSLVSCGTDASCSDATGTAVCACDPGFIGDGLACVPGVIEVASGFYHACARFTGGGVKCWGSSLARGGSPVVLAEPSQPYLDLGTGRTAKHVVAGYEYGCALLDNDSVKCWGYNEWGQLGQGNVTIVNTTSQMGDDLPSLSLGTGRTVKKLAAGATHACVILDDNSLKCWGSNDWGALGLGDTSHRGDAPNEMGDNLPSVDLGTGRYAIDVKAGHGHTCALLDNGTFKCWGFNDFGQLGLEHTNTLGDQANEMGDNLPPVNLGTGRAATALSLGVNYGSCALLDNGSIKCWGPNGFGQLGKGDTDGIGYAPNHMGDNLPAIPLGTGRTAVAVAAALDRSVCAILDDGSVKCWGQNEAGELGLGDTLARGDQPNEMGDNLPAVSLGTGRTASTMSAGYQFACAVLDNSSLKCWGKPDGNGTDAQLGDEANEMGDTLPSLEFF